MDRDPLAAALDSIQVARSDFMGSEPGHVPRMVITGLAFGGLDVITDAARERLAQMVEKCGTCGGTGGLWEGGEAMPRFSTCPSCHSRGTVYPAALVERIAEVLDWWTDGDSKAEAAAVLDALNNETPKHLRKGAGPVVGPAELDTLNQP